MAGFFASSSAGPGSLQPQTAERRPLNMNRVFAVNDAAGPAAWPPRSVGREPLGAAQRRGHHSLSLHHWSAEQEIQRLEAEATCRRRELEWHMPRVAAEIERLRPLQARVNTELSSMGNRHAAAAVKEDERMDRLESALRRLEDFASNSSVGAGSGSSSQTVSVPSQSQFPSARAEEHGRNLEGQLYALRQRIEETKLSTGVAPVSEGSSCDESIIFIASVQRYQALELKWRLLEKQVGEAKRMGLGQQASSSLDNLLASAADELQQLRELIERPPLPASSAETAELQMKAASAPQNADGGAGFAAAPAPEIHDRSPLTASWRTTLPVHIHDSSKAPRETSSDDPGQEPRTSSPRALQDRALQLQLQIRELQAEDSQQKLELQRQVGELQADADAKRNQIRLLEQDQRALKEQLHTAMVEAGANDAKLLHANERLKQSEAREQSLVEKLVSASSLAASAAAKRTAQVQGLQAQLAQAEGELLLLRAQQAEAEAEAELQAMAAATPPPVEKSVSDNAVQCDVVVDNMVTAPSELQQVSEKLRNVRERLLSGPPTPQQPLSPTNGSVTDWALPDYSGDRACEAPTVEASLREALEVSGVRGRIRSALQDAAASQTLHLAIHQAFLPPRADEEVDDAEVADSEAVGCELENEEEEVQAYIEDESSKCRPTWANTEALSCIQAKEEQEVQADAEEIEALSCSLAAEEPGMPVYREDASSKSREDATPSDLELPGTAEDSLTEMPNAGSPASPQSASEVAEREQALDREPVSPIPDHVHVRSSLNERSSRAVCCGDLLGITSRRRKFFEGRQQTSPTSKERAESSLSPQDSPVSPSENEKGGIGSDVPQPESLELVTDIAQQAAEEQAETSSAAPQVQHSPSVEDSSSEGTCRRSDAPVDVAKQVAEEEEEDSTSLPQSLNNLPVDNLERQGLGPELAMEESDCIVPDTQVPRPKAKVVPGGRLAGGKYDGDTLRLRRYERSVRAVERRHGPDHLEVTVPLELLAEQYKQQDRLDEHHAALERVLQIRLSASAIHDGIEGSSSASDGGDAAAAAAGSVDVGDSGSDAPQVDCGVDEPAWQPQEDSSEASLREALEVSGVRGRIRSALEDAARRSKASLREDFEVSGVRGRIRSALEDAAASQTLRLAFRQASSATAALTEIAAPVEDVAEVDATAADKATLDEVVTVEALPEATTSAGDSEVQAAPDETSSVFRISSTPNRGLPCAFSETGQDVTDSSGRKDSGFNPFAPPAVLESWLSPSIRGESKKAFNSPPNRDTSPPPDHESSRGSSRRGFSPPREQEHDANDSASRSELASPDKFGVSWPDTAAASTNGKERGWVASQAAEDDQMQWLADGSSSRSASGDDNMRWPADNSTSSSVSGEDENMQWPAESSSSTPAFGDGDTAWPATMLAPAESSSSTSAFGDGDMAWPADSPEAFQPWGAQQSESGRASMTDTGWSTGSAFSEGSSLWPSDSLPCASSDLIWGASAASFPGMNAEEQYSGSEPAGDANMLWATDSTRSTGNVTSLTTTGSTEAGNPDMQWTTDSPLSTGSGQIWDTLPSSSIKASTSGPNVEQDMWSLADDSSVWGMQPSVSIEASAAGADVEKDAWSSAGFPGEGSMTWQVKSPPPVDPDQIWGSQPAVCPPPVDTDQIWGSQLAASIGRSGEPHVQSTQPQSTSSGNWAEDATWPTASASNPQAELWPASDNWASAATWPAEAAGWPASESTVTASTNWAGEAWAELATSWP